MKKFAVGSIVILTAAAGFAQTQTTASVTATPGFQPTTEQKGEAWKAYWANQKVNYEQPEMQKQASRGFLPEHHVSMDPAAPKLPHQPKGMSVREMDTNHTGVITIADFKAAHNKSVKDRFEKIDANHDGKISPAEWQAAGNRQHNRHVVRDDKAEAAMPAFAELDTNKDGFISETEFWVGSTMAGLHRFEEVEK